MGILINKSHKGATMPALKTNLAIILSITLSHAALIQKEMEFSPGQGIDVSANTIQTLTTSGAFSTEMPSNCADLNKGSVDLSFFHFGFWDDFTCGCGGEMLSLVSNDTIRYITNLSAFDVSKPLNINDTTLFKIPTVFERTKCNGWTAPCPYFQNPCPVCKTGPASNWTPPPSVWYLTRTDEGNYVLFRFTARSPKAAISYVLQTDGSLNFKGATAALTRPAANLMHSSSKTYITKIGPLSKVPGGARAYDIRGRAIHSSSQASAQPNRAPMLYIIQQEGAPRSH
jgi:hypothetical protein